MTALEFFDKFTFDELSELQGIIASVKSKKEKMLPETIKNSDISKRTRNALLFLDIFNWSDLSLWSEFDLMRGRRIGTMTLKEIKEQLEMRNISLKS